VRPIALGNKAFIVLCLIALIGIVIALYSNSTLGVGISPDSVDYISTGENLLAGHGFVKFDGEPFVLWPPLFPSLLAIFGAFGLNLLVAARFMNALAFGAIIILSGLVYFRLVKSIGLALIGALIVLVSLPLLEVTIFAWTEPIFVVLELLAIHQVLSFLEHPRRGHLIWTLVFASLCCLTRYIGVAVVLVCAAIIFDLFTPRERGRRLLASAGYVFMALLPVMAWCGRNRLLTGTLTGERGLSVDPWLARGSDALRTMGSWFVPYRVPPPVVFLFLLSGAGVFLLLQMWRQSNEKQRGSDVLRRGVALLVLFLFCYMALLIITLQSGVLVEGISNRFLAPVFPIVVGLVLVTVENMHKWILSRFASTTWVGRIGIVVICCWLVLPISRAVAFVKEHRLHGAGGYTTVQWRSSPILVEIGRLHDETPIVSNASTALYALAGISSRPLPFKNEGTSHLRREIEKSESIYYVHFKPGIYWTTSNARINMLLSLDDLAREFRITEIISAEDGTLFRIELPL